jgi:hypothetical protein
MRNVPDKSCGENQHTCFDAQYTFSENLALYEFVWKNLVEPEWPQMIIYYGAWALQSG